MNFKTQNSEADKNYYFVKLCSALTKRGFHFKIAPDRCLIVDRIHFNWKFPLSSDYAKTPNVRWFIPLNFTHNEVLVKPVFN